MNRLLTSAAAFALLASSALAADLTVIEPAPVLEPVVETGWDWSGFYAGGFAGYGWGNVVVDDEDGYNPPAGTFDYEAEGFYAGSLIGYNMHWDWVLVGIEAELGHMEFEEERQDPLAPAVDGDSIASVDMDFFGNISGRLGLTWDNWLVYGKGGFAFTDLEVRYDDSNPALNNGANATLVSGNATDDWVTGWTAGGGVEFGAWNGFTVRGEYMYTELDDLSHTATSNTGTEFTFSHEIEEIHTAKIGFTRQF